MCTKHLPRVMGCLLSVVLTACLASPARGATGTILLIVANSGSLNAQETARKTMMEGWGYTVTPLSDGASAATFTSDCLSASCAYICLSVNAANVTNKLLSTPIPVLIEDEGLTDDFLMGSGGSTYTATAINITNTSHYITSAFASGSLTICGSSSSLTLASGLAAGMTTLAQRVSSASPVLVVCERGDALTSGTAAGRRVLLPWGGSSMNFTDLNANGQLLLRRAIEWCLLPVCWWKYDEGTGSTCADSVSGRTGTRSGAAWTTGKLSNALDFDGVDDFVSFADHQHFKVTSALTVAAWIRADAAWPTSDYTATILRKGDGNPNNWNFEICSGRMELLLDGSDNAGFKGNTTLSINTWHHVAATWNGDRVRLYLNGVLDNSPPTRTGTIGTDTRTIYSGGRTGPTDCHNGKLDDVRFYNRALTAAEIVELSSVSKTVTTWRVVTPQ